MPSKLSRVALFGGTFDPPHRGHVAIARAAADRFALDTVLFAPAGRQPLKPEGCSTDYAERLEMTRLVCAEDARFAVSELDAPRKDGQPNYTVRTLEMLAEEMPGAAIFSIAGADSFRSLGHWREPQRLLELADWIVISRPGFLLAEPDGLALTPEQRARVHLLDAVHEDVSATGLRTRLAHGESCDELLTPSVAAFIAEHGLYRS
ncbi:nicotinate-nucleotide adenylyltransferase [Granulicella tundricola]|uniref:Probable nicotinate-nucleotide adenylyltransferase n=1 Tax=Granulicella tundricola (strain ATCC BAA-1859 / DSM 23138 / MP5ACTX9) TaxID=1198114 RepID=E8WVY2_GRATM|nr:nicotinate-nucleotide adenylyltransferase [Granulicella tundricola]ADW70741.1 nicotinate (nicotinamide) nucleotide adenylyltransferase [Granulicella tundricola MP5ACTX9]